MLPAGEDAHERWAKPLVEKCLAAHERSLADAHKLAAVTPLKQASTTRGTHGRRTRRVVVLLFIHRSLHHPPPAPHHHHAPRPTSHQPHKLRNSNRASCGYYVSLAHTRSHLRLALWRFSSAVPRPHALASRRRLATLWPQQARGRAARAAPLAALDSLRRRALPRRLRTVSDLLSGVVVASGVYERWGKWGYLNYCVACALPYVLVPLFSPSPADRVSPLSPPTLTLSRLTRASGQAVARALRGQG